MPPQIAFVKLTNHYVIPFKIFVKKKDSTSDDQVSYAINQRSLITLNRSDNYQTRVSNSYLNRLLNEILADFIKSKLFETPIEEFIKQTTSVHRYQDDKIQCKMVVDVAYLIALRYRLGRILPEEWALLGVKSSEEMETTYKLGKSELKLMNWESEIKFLQEDEDEMVDDKKTGLYKLKKLEILGGMKDSVRLFLIS